jgi:Tfp pilus assembly protein PilV
VSRVTRRAFTLVEILVVVVLMSLIVLALMAVFSSTQAAFRASITQTDVLEGGRSVMGLIKSDLEPMTPSYLNATNFYAAVVGNSFPQPLTGSSASRTNVMEDVFFITRQNQTWKGVGYFVRSNLSVSGMIGTPGVLYRFETNNSVAQFAQNPGLMFATYDQARMGNMGVNPTNGVSRILDGVMDFKMRAFDTNGFWITANHTNLTVINVVAMINVNNPEVMLYTFYSNAVPAAVEVELGVLEDRTLQRAESLSGAAQLNYLSNHVGQVHLFRQRFLIRNVDPSAYR